MFKRFTLGVKFNLILLVVFLIGAASSWFAIDYVMDYQAEGQVAANAKILLHTMKAVRYYTTKDTAPPLKQLQQTQNSFIPESVPGFSASQVFKYFSDPDPK